MDTDADDRPRGARAARAAHAWDEVRAFALGLPAAVEDFPWGEPVVKAERPGPPPAWRRGLAHGPMFLWLGRRDVEPPAVASVCVKLRSSYDAAVALAGATPTTISGLGQWGWLTVPLDAVDVDVVCDWVVESYCNRAPKQLVAQLRGDAAGMPVTMMQPDGSPVVMES